MAELRCWDPYDSEEDAAEAFDAISPLRAAECFTVGKFECGDIVADTVEPTSERGRRASGRPSADSAVDQGGVR